MNLGAAPVLYWRLGLPHSHHSSSVVGGNPLKDKSIDRDTVVTRRTEDLVGTRAENEELTARPSDVCLTGILWPQRTAMSGEDDERLGIAGTGSGVEGVGESDAVRAG